MFAGVRAIGKWEKKPPDIRVNAGLFVGLIFWSDLW